MTPTGRRTVGRSLYLPEAPKKVGANDQNPRLSRNCFVDHWRELAAGTNRVRCRRARIDTAIGYARYSYGLSGMGHAAKVRQLGIPTIYDKRSGEPSYLRNTY
jgi:hypothetical protein